MPSFVNNLKPLIISVLSDETVCFPVWTLPDATPHIIKAPKILNTL